MEPLSERVALRLDAVLVSASAAVIGCGVMVLGWSPFIVIVLYWVENVVIGVSSLAKILLSGARHSVGGLSGALGTGVFFTMHYGLFTVGHGVLLAQFLGSTELGRGAADGGLFGPLGATLHYLLSDREGWLAVIAILAVHVGLFIQWSLRTRELPIPVNELILAPYGRMIVLHITLLAGAFLMQAFHAPKFCALLLIALKLAYDLVSLKRDRRVQDDSVAYERVRRLLAFGRRNLDGRP